jgi:hypothetical protein
VTRGSHPSDLRSQLQQPCPTPCVDARPKGFYWQLLFNVERTPEAPPAAGAGAGGAGAGAGAVAGAGAGADAAADGNGLANGGGAAAGGAGAGAAGGRGGAAAGAASGGGGGRGAVIEFVGVRCSASLGLLEAWPRWGQGPL